MAFTQADLDRVDKAIVRGTLEITYSDGIKIRYPGITALKEARALISEGINQAGTTTRRIRQVRVNVRSGI